MGSKGCSKTWNGRIKTNIIGEHVTIENHIQPVNAWICKTYIYYFDLIMNRVVWSIWECSNILLFFPMGVVIFRILWEELNLIVGNGFWLNPIIGGCLILRVFWIVCSSPGVVMAYYRIFGVENWFSPLPFFL